MTGQFTYPVEMSADEDGRSLVLFPDFPEAATDGADWTEAMGEAADCLEAAIAGRIVDRSDIPPPSPARGRPTVSVGAVIAAKAALYLAMRASGTTNVALARRLACDEAEVRRLLSPRHTSKIGRLEEALRALGKQLEVTVRDAA